MRMIHNSLYNDGGTCTEACSKRLCLENQQNPNEVPESYGYFLPVTV